MKREDFFTHEEEPEAERPDLTNASWGRGKGSGRGAGSTELGARSAGQGAQSPRQGARGRVGHEEIYSLITGDEISWQAIIYNLVRSEQLDPLDLDIILLTRAFLEKMHKLEESNFFVSGKVLLAASILLRMKADRVFNQLQYLDELLNGKEEEEELASGERYFIPAGELPLILPRTPLPRLKKVTIEELMSALKKAIEVEERRHRRFESIFEAERDAGVVLPIQRINITQKIEEIFNKIKAHFSVQGTEALTFSKLLPSDKKEDKIATFVPLLHLDTREKITLEQQEAFGEIYISLFKKLEAQIQELEKEFKGEKHISLSEELGGEGHEMIGIFGSTDALKAKDPVAKLKPKKK